MKKGLLLLCLSMFCSCATIVNGKKEMFQIKTSPEGATAEIAGKHCKTPCSLELNRGQNYVLRISKLGYKDTQIELDGSSADGWLWGNVLLGGVIGLAIDYGSGAAYDFEPESVDLPLIKGDGGKVNRSKASVGN